MFCCLHIKYVSYKKIYAESSVVHTCFVFGQNYSRGLVDLWPESTHAHTYHAPKRKKPSRMEERHAARVAAAVAGSTGNGGAQPLPSVTGRRVMISRELLVYLAEPDQIDVDGFNLLGFCSRRG